MATPIAAPPAGPATPRIAAASDARRAQYLEVRGSVHRKLLSKLNLEKLATAERSRVEAEIRALVSQLIAEAGMPLSVSERDAILGDVIDEVFGFGPLEPLLRDKTVSDILVNTYKQVFVERAGRLEAVPAAFQDDQHLLRVIDRIVSGVGRRIDDSSPMVDARLPDGSRVNAIIAPLAVDGPLLSIRRFPADRLKADDLVAFKAVAPNMLEFLRHCVASKLNILVSGGTGAGKTTLLNVLSSFISDRDRIVTIEDAAELQLRQEHVVRLETRPPNVEGKGAVRQRQLLINSLRMRPDRIIVGEVRGEEALDMLQAMNTGHDGSLTTVHANTPRDALSRLETMVAMANVNLPDKAMRQQIAAAIQIVVQQARMADGTRKVTSISEITGMEGDVITMQEIFRFDKLGLSQEGKVVGRFVATGVRPKVCERLLQSGIQLAPDLFVGQLEVRPVTIAILVILAFVAVTAGVMGVFMFVSGRSEAAKEKAIENRLNEVGNVAAPLEPGEATLVREQSEGLLPQVETAARHAIRGSKFERWLEQSGTTLSLSACFVISLSLGGICAFLALMIAKQLWAAPIGFVVGLLLLPGLLRFKRTRRLNKFEEQFPEALDLLSRGIRAGHAFSAGMKMVADELGEPVGPEFRKAFDEQNFGLPLKESLNNLCERVPILDVRFFTTAVLIQRETGGNLSEILDNLAAVVRERFKIRRQIRVHTAHGRFTGYVLMALPGFLGVALSMINPEHMDMLFEDHMGQMMIMGAIVMQVIGYFWIKQVIKIEV